MRTIAENFIANLNTMENRCRRDILVGLINKSDFSAEYVPGSKLREARLSKTEQDEIDSVVYAFKDRNKALQYWKDYPFDPISHEYYDLNGMKFVEEDFYLSNRLCNLARSYRGILEFRFPVRDSPVVWKNAEDYKC